MKSPLRAGFLGLGQLGLASQRLRSVAANIQGLGREAGLQGAQGSGWPQEPSKPDWLDPERGHRGAHQSGFHIRNVAPPQKPRLLVQARGLHSSPRVGFELRRTTALTCGLYGCPLGFRSPGRALRAEVRYGKHTGPSHTSAASGRSREIDSPDEVTEHSRITSGRSIRPPLRESTLLSGELSSVKMPSVDFDTGDPRQLRRDVTLRFVAVSRRVRCGR